MKKRARQISGIIKCRELGMALHSTQNSQKGSKTHKTEFDFGKLITEYSSVKMIRQSEKENWLVYFSSIHKISSNSISIWLHVENKHQQLQASPPFSFLIRWNQMKPYSENWLSVANDGAGMKNINQVTREKKKAFCTYASMLSLLRSR